MLLSKIPVMDSPVGRDSTTDHLAGAKLPDSPETIALWIKLLYTAFTAVLVVYYWKEYGPTNFLYFCDVALFLGAASIWTGKPIFASMAAVGILIPQLLWQIDFVGGLFGTSIIGMTQYMFDPGISLFARGLSFFHFWLPGALLFVIWKLGYDPRAMLGWTILAWGLMLIAYFFLPAPGDVLRFANQPCNVNFVFGLNDNQPQTMMPPLAWLASLMIGLPLVCYLPAHLMLKRWF